jgi:hypothetical protein
MAMCTLTEGFVSAGEVAARAYQECIALVMQQDLSPYLSFGPVGM